MQMQKILVAYATNAGTTAQVAQAIGGELSKGGVQVDVLRVDQVTQVEPYAAVVIGAPMIMGWHGAAMKFVKEHQSALRKVPVAYFYTAMNLTRTGETSLDGVPVYVDPALAKPPKDANHLSFKERYATVANYLRPVLKAAPLVKPVSVGFFGGRLDLSRLNIFQVIFVLFIIQAKPGGSHNIPFIRTWAAGLCPKLLPTENPAG
jgi:menaquinone-dependent protoporphyrinogen oxidase